MIRSAVAPFVLALILVGASAPRAAGEEPASEAAALAQKIADLRKAEDTGALEAAVKEVPAVHKAATDPAEKGLLEDALGKVLKDKKAASARSASAEALAQLEDKKAAWKQLSGSLPDRKVEEHTELDLAILKAAGAIADDRAIDPLLELAAKAKAVAIAREATDALGGFGQSKKRRVGVLEELVSLGVRTKPSSGAGKAASPAAEERWKEVGPAIIRALNKLTGQNYQQFDDWYDIYKQNEKSLGKLFKETAE
jgi:hypothetical protein